MVCQDTERRAKAVGVRCGEGLEERKVEVANSGNWRYNNHRGITMSRRSLRRYAIGIAVGGGLTLVVLLCLGVALVRSIRPLAELTAEAEVTATPTAVPLTAETPAATITATFPVPTPTPTTTDTRQPTDTPAPSTTPTETPLPTETPVPSATATGTLLATETPALSPTPSETPTITPTPSTLVARGATSYTKSNGDLHVVGEVLNSTSGSICDVRIVSTFYDASDQVVAIAAAYTMLDIVGSGEVAPFDVVVPDPPSGIDRQELQVDYEITSTVPLRLEVVNHSGSTQSDGNYHILGEVRNQHAFTVNSVRVVATIYNTENEVLRAIISYTVIDTLVQNQTSPFDLALIDPPTELNHYSLTVEADKQ